MIIYHYRNLSFNFSEKLTYDVPEIFLRVSFDLSNPETFNFVFPCISECIKPTERTATDTISMNSPSNRPRLLQERVNFYFFMTNFFQFIFKGVRIEQRDYFITIE